MKQLRMSSENTFDSLSDQEQQATVQMMTYKFQSMIPVSIANDPEGIRQLTKEALDDLKLSELELKELDRQEQKMSQRLASTNRTLYALQGIHKRRKQPGTCHSLENTGFEFTMRPVIKSESLANASFHASSYLRLCIKTTGFLGLEDWEIELDLRPYESSSTSVVVVGETRTLPVMGFETIYENGIERYSAWERDIELDLEKVKLPLEVSVCLTMGIEHDAPSLRFPVSKMVIDDLHFAIPCSADFITTVHRRGLEQVSHKLMKAYHKQVLYDKSNRYPFARLLRSKSSSDLTLFKSLFDYKNVHIRCLVDLHITNEGYQSILSRILNEGRTMDEMKSLLISAEQVLFTLAAFPGCPVIIELSRVSSTVIDFNIQCVYAPALFKVEAALLSRLLDQFIQVPSEPSDEKEGLKYANFLKRMKVLEQSILNLQDDYQEKKDKMEIDEEPGAADSLFKQLKSSVDLLLEIYNEEPIGQFIM
ncbi:hypothetical protein BD770DRAFT_97830 [Pilaira anomala]|nr:hypothetical protein BD770DRAFT_97830 [Pilaira anomala]